MTARVPLRKYLFKLDFSFKVEHGGEDLKVFFLTRNGRVFIWQDNRHQTQATFSVFNASKYDLKAFSWIWISLVYVFALEYYYKGIYSGVWILHCSILLFFQRTLGCGSLCRKRGLSVCAHQRRGRIRTKSQLKIELHSSKVRFSVGGFKVRKSKIRQFFGHSQSEKPATVCLQSCVNFLWSKRKKLQCVASFTERRTVRPTWSWFLDHERRFSKSLRTNRRIRSFARLRDQSRRSNILRPQIHRGKFVWKNV